MPVVELEFLHEAHRIARFKVSAARSAEFDDAQSSLSRPLTLFALPISTKNGCKAAGSPVSRFSEYETDGTLMTDRFGGLQVTGPGIARPLWSSSCQAEQPML